MGSPSSNARCRTESTVVNRGTARSTVKPSYALTMALAVPAAIGAAALSTGATRRFFDYDEIYHAHATWQIAHGLRPFHDFQASHAPFLWYPLAAAWRIFPESPASLIPLRFIAAAGTLLS